MLDLLRRIYHALPLSPGWRHRIGTWRRRWLTPTRRRTETFVQTTPALDSASLCAELAIARARTPHRDYFFFGVIDWHFRHQRPQQMALALARAGRRVFYVSVNFTDHKEAGFSLERLAPHLALYQISLFVHGPLNVYTDRPEGDQLAQLKASLGELWLQADTRLAVHVVQHPFWHEVASYFPAARVLYDCMDHHAGFANTAPHHAELEQVLLKSADCTIVTSDFLEDYATRHAKSVQMIRNACDFVHFNQAVQLRTQQNPKPVIGYYGAIAEWFDVDLMTQLAKHLPDCEFILIGADTVDAAARLRSLSNVHMLGEKPYAELPQWLSQFDVCLIPFQINDLTLATNPVKVYEYLSAGKPVVGTALPELLKLGQLVYVARSHTEFIDQVRQALTEHGNANFHSEERIAYARQQTWDQRTARMIEVAENNLVRALTSVVVISYNQWHLTQRCLESVVAHADVPMEIIVVDNASHDETGPQLQAWSRNAPSQRIVIANDRNLGFAAAVNQGLARARGEFLVVLNNDIMVSEGWLRGMQRHFEHRPQLGLLCPVTNNIGNEAQIIVAGSTAQQMIESSRSHCLRHAGDILELSVAAFFCVMLPRTVYQAVGGLDERFFPGFFEDDDFSLRVREAGWIIACAEDVFVHHELSASFNKEGATRKQEIFERNKKLFEEKWGPWQPHKYRA